MLLVLPPRRANRLSHALQMLVDHLPRNSYILCRASNQLFFLYNNHGKTLIQARSRNRVAEQFALGGVKQREPLLPSTCQRGTTSTPERILLNKRRCRHQLAVEYRILASSAYKPKSSSRI